MKIKCSYLNESDKKKCAGNKRMNFFLLDVNHTHVRLLIWILFLHIYFFIFLLHASKVTFQGLTLYFSQESLFIFATYIDIDLKGIRTQHIHTYNTATIAMRKKDRHTKGKPLSNPLSAFVMFWYNIILQLYPHTNTNSELNYIYIVNPPIVASYDESDQLSNFRSLSLF